MSVNWQDIAFSFLGGLGLFLFSIKYMGMVFNKQPEISCAFTSISIPATRF